jgi:hypothetical protein
MLAAPALAVIVLVALGPILWTFWESLHLHDLRMPWLGRPFIGVANYAEVLRDVRFWSALGHTTVFVVTSVSVELSLGLVLAILLGAAYGFFMGWYAITSRTSTEAYQQMLASVVKLPALFLLTLVVTFPSLYVFNALVGCRLSFTATLRLLIGAVAVNLAVAASLGPILGFFTVSTTSYTFMILLNVVLLGIGGLVGLGFLLQTLRRLAAPSDLVWRAEPKTPPLASALDTENGEPAPARTPGPLEPPSSGFPTYALGSARSIFRVWVIIYALVGAQMGWLLRPFIGSPTMPFTWFRPREGNFFQAVGAHLMALFNIHG